MLRICLSFMFVFLFGTYTFGSDSLFSIKSVPSDFSYFSYDRLAVSSDFDSDDGFDEFDDFMDEDSGSVPTVWDPLEGYNRVMTGFNDVVFRYVMNPVAKGYAFVVPKVGRNMVKSFFRNLAYPVRFVNNVLQLKFVRAGSETVRFVVNSTLGVGGLFDPATHWFSIGYYPEDFGQTLGAYGVGPGPYLVLPFLGPSSLRDAIGLVPEVFIDPLVLNPDTADHTLSFKAVEVVNLVSLQLGVYERLKASSLDFYLFSRDAYLQNRQKAVKE